MGFLQSGLSYIPAHLLMNVSIMGMFGTIILTGVFKKNVFWFVYAGILVGALLFFIQHELGVLIIFFIPLVFVWNYIKHNRFLLKTTLLLFGFGLVLAGIIIDWFWHRANPDIGEAHNMLLVIGHQIQLVGWGLGLLNILVIMFLYRDSL
ncbi:MAG: hypothetical protein LPK26_08805 [Bacillaceae bacterium]|nr:hypothetical protein [Bacillaceae bacterium]